MKERKIIDWFKPHWWGAAAIDCCDQLTLNTTTPTLGEALTAFDWNQSIQGTKFWQHIYDVSVSNSAMAV
jgi:hypothetical protein